MKTKFICLAFAAILFVGCDNIEFSENVVEQLQKENIVCDSDITEQNTMLSDYACMLASVLEDSDVRSVIKAEAQKRFDGDYDILVDKFHALNLQKYAVSVRKYMVQKSATKINTKSTISGNPLDMDALISNLQEAIPNLQISVPVHCDEWNVESYVPLVAFLPIDYNEQTDTTIMAYDVNGNVHVLSLEVEPEVPVVVVGRSERVDENGCFLAGTGESIYVMDNLLRTAPAAPSTLSVSHGIARQLLVEWPDVSNETGYEIWRQSTSASWAKIAQTVVNDNNYTDNNLSVGSKYWYKIRSVNADGTSAWSPIYARIASGRTDGESLTLAAMKFTTSGLKSVEKWASGAPELRLRVVKGNENNTAVCVFTSGKLEPARRKDIENTWWYYTLPIVTWNTDAIGTVLTFDWREEDWNNNVSFDITGSYEQKFQYGGTIKAGGTVHVANNQGGAHVGTVNVLWWDNKATEYTTGGFFWKFS